MKTQMLKGYSALILALIVSACSQPEQEVRESTATSNVQVLAPTFVLPEVNRHRKVRLYLPPGYHQSTQSYPVLYMHDGQNLFDYATSFVGEWQVDESLNVLAREGKLELIVVGIDNGNETRMNELSPWPNEEFGKAEGKLYVEFLLDVVKPYIDTNFRTKSDVANTAIMGSSMGGLISHYAIHQHPDVFSKAAIFSPSYWYNQDVYPFTRFNKVPTNTRLYFVVGSEEGGDMVEDMEKMVAQIAAQGHPDKHLFSKVVEGAKHNEQFWASEFSDAVQWLFNHH